MTLPGPAFQECTGSCHEYVPHQRPYHLIRIGQDRDCCHLGTLSTILQPSSCNYADKIPIDLFYLQSAMDRSQYVVFAKKVTAFQPKLF